MYLFGQQLFTKSVEADEFACKQTSIYEAFCHQHDLTDQLKVWDHHGTGPEQLANQLVNQSSLTFVNSCTLNLPSFSLYQT